MVAMIGMTMVLGQPVVPPQIDTAPASPFAAVAANGWQATYPAPPAFDPVGAPVTLAVTRPGFDASGTAVTVVDNVIVNGRLRQPYPNQATPSADTVVMSEVIHAGDTLPAGVTNSSTRVYPKPMTCWLEHDHFAITGPSFDVNLVVAHKFARAGRPVAAVRIIASDGTTTREQVISALSWNTWAATGLGVDSFRATFPSADFAAGVAITVDAIIYPWCGPSYQLSTQGNAAPNMKNTVIRGYRVTPVYCYVSASGNNATGVASTDPATAAANPCLTINGAAVKIRAANNSLFARDEIGGGVIRFPVGTWVVDSTGTGEVPVTTACVVYESINPADKAVTILTDNGTTKGARNIAQRALLRNLTLRKAGDAVVILRSTGGTTTSLVFDNCDFDANGQSVRTYWINFAGRMWIRDCRNTNGSVGLLNPNGTDPKNAVSIGSSIPGNVAISQIACRVPGVSAGGAASGAVTLGYAQGMIVNCFVSGNSGGGFQMTFEGNFLATAGLGYAVIGTVIESYGAGAGAVRAWADSDTNTVHDFLYMGNTTPGLSDQTRFNRFYNDVTGSPASKAATIKFNAISSSGCKTDTFSADGNCTGNWPVVMGVGHAYNSLLRGQTLPNSQVGGGSWHFEVPYPGIQIGNGAGGTLDARWTLDGSVSGSNTGGGDYRPQPGSPLNRIPAGMTITARDMLGRAIPDDGSAFVGALATSP